MTHRLQDDLTDEQRVFVALIDDILNADPAAGAKQRCSTGPVCVEQR